MLSGDASFEFMSGLEDNFGPQIYGGDVARLRPAKHFARVEEPIIEPTRLYTPRTPLTEEEIEDVLSRLDMDAEQGECGL